MRHTYHDQGFNVVLFESAFTKQGPFSDRRRDEPPGPPFSQMDNGALRGSLRDSKNQKNLQVINRIFIDNQGQCIHIYWIVLGLAVLVDGVWRKMDIATV